MMRRMAFLQSRMRLDFSLLRMPHRSWRFPSAPAFESGIERHPAIEVKRRSREIVRLVGDEPHRRAAEIVRFPNALIGDQLQQRLVRLGRFPSGPVDRSANGTGCKSHYPDSLRGIFLRDAL